MDEDGTPGAARHQWQLTRARRPACPRRLCRAGGRCGFRSAARMARPPLQRRSHVVVIGAGGGSLARAQLAGECRHHHLFLFQPLSGRVVPLAHGHHPGCGWSDRATAIDRDARRRCWRAAGVGLRPAGAVARTTLSPTLSRLVRSDAALMPIPQERRSGGAADAAGAGDAAGRIVAPVAPPPLSLPARTYERGDDRLTLRRVNLTAATRPHDHFTKQVLFEEGWGR